MLRQIRILAALAVVLTVMVVAFASHAPTAAIAGGTSSGPLDGHPAVGTWTVVLDGELALFAFTDDGILIASDKEGTSALGAWDAPDDQNARFTLIGLISDEDGSFSTVLRGTMAIDAAGDTATIDLTGSLIGLDGTVYYSAGIPATATRLPVEGPELTGSPVAGFPTIAAGTPDADRQEVHFEVTIEAPLGTITLTDDGTATPTPTEAP